MKLIPLIALLAGLFLSPIASAADAWELDFKAATERAAKENKLILVDFTGSDWCPPCKMLEKDVLSQKSFLDYAEKNLVLVKLDFDQSGAKPSKFQADNDALAVKYKIEGFPTVLLLNSQGKVLDQKVGYVPGGPEAFVKWIESVSAKK